MGIMKPSYQTTIWVSWAALCVLTFAGTAQAQSQFGTPPARRPTISPYLNLLRGTNGGGIGLDYYGIVRPEQQYYRAADQFRQDISNLNRRVDEGQTRQQTPESRALETSILSPTGHPATFFSTGSYFPASRRR